MKAAADTKKTHNLFGEAYRASCLRENLTNSSYGEGLETGRELAQEPRQSFTRQQMIKDLKQRLGFGDYQVRDLQAIQRHVALVLLSYFVLILLKTLQWLKDKTISLDLSIRWLAFQVRKNILLENITVTLKTMQIRFKQNILDTYLEALWA